MIKNKRRMIRLIKRTALALITAGMVLSLSCTSNPFFDDKVESSGNRTVRGTIQLNDGTVPENIFVWLEGFNLSARTDRMGKFKITLPLPQTQPGGGLTGLYKLFYYVGNYEYQTSALVVRNGRFVFDAEDMDAQGNISKTIVLRKFLDIKTVIEPDTLVLMKRQSAARKGLSKTAADTVWENGSAPEVTVRIRLTPRLRNVQIQYYRLNDNVSACAGFSDTKVSEPNVRFLFSTSRRVLTSQAVPAAVELVMTKRWSFSLLNPGNYKILPFLLTVQNGVPEALYAAFGEDALSAAPDYLNIPFKLTADTLHIMQTLY